MTHELVYLAPSQLREPLITCRLGNGDGAAEAHAAATRLWQQASPALRDRAADVGRQLQQMGVTLAVADTSR